MCKWDGLDFSGLEKELCRNDNGHKKSPNNISTKASLLPPPPPPPPLVSISSDSPKSKVTSQFKQLKQISENEAKLVKLHWKSLSNDISKDTLWSQLPKLMVNSEDFKGLFQIRE